MGHRLFLCYEITKAFMLGSVELYERLAQIRTILKSGIFMNQVRCLFGISRLMK